MNTISKKFGGEVGSLEGRKFKYTGNLWFPRESEITLEEDDDTEMPLFSGRDYEGVFDFFYIDTREVELI